MYKYLKKRSQIVDCCRLVVSWIRRLQFSHGVSFSFFIPYQVLKTYIFWHFSEQEKHSNQSIRTENEFTRINQYKAFLSLYTFENEHLSCRQINITGKRIRIEIPRVSPGQRRGQPEFYIHQTEYFHSQYKLKVPIAYPLENNIHLMLESEIVKELPTTNGDCEDGAEFDVCYNSLLLQHMNKSVGCIPGNSE